MKEIKIIVKEVLVKKTKQTVKIYNTIDNNGEWHSVKFSKDYKGYKPEKTCYCYCHFNFGKKQPDFTTESGKIIKGTYDIWVNGCEFSRDDDFKEELNELKNKLFG